MTKDNSLILKEASDSLDKKGLYKNPRYSRKGRNAWKYKQLSNK